MQVVINIPEEMYKWVNDANKTFNDYGMSDFIDLVKKGTLIPKGHEKLIAEPTEEDIAKTVGGQNDFAECIRDAVKAVFDNASTIIEADRSEDE